MIEVLPIERFATTLPNGRAASTDNGVSGIRTAEAARALDVAESGLRGRGSVGGVAASAGTTLDGAGVENGRSLLPFPAPAARFPAPPPLLLVRLNRAAAGTDAGVTSTKVVAAATGVVAAAAAAAATVAEAGCRTITSISAAAAAAAAAAAVAAATAALRLSAPTPEFGRGGSGWSGLVGSAVCLNAWVREEI